MFNVDTIVIDCDYDSYDVVFCGCCRYCRDAAGDGLHPPKIMTRAKIQN